MKVLMLNGSPKTNGNTATALAEMETVFAKHGIETETITVGNLEIRGCTGCDTCRWLCKVQAISFDHEGAHVDPEKCVGCGNCYESCQPGAIVPYEV